MILVGQCVEFIPDVASFKLEHLFEFDSTLRCVHADLEDCVGQATAAFAMELLRGRSGHSSAELTIPAGVWYPAELQATVRKNILEVARENALVWEI